MFKNCKKTIIHILILALALVVSSLALAEEAEVVTSGDFSYIVMEDGTIQIINYNGSDSKLVIPAELDGKAVTSIGDRAFYWCPSINSITFPDSIIDMGSNPIADCENLTDINVSPDHPYLATIDGVLFSKPDKRLIGYPCAFTQSKYTVPEGILVIGEEAFYGCKSLTSITIPETVTTIEDQAFYYCRNITSFSIPNSVTSIGANPFTSCGSLSQIEVSPDHPCLTFTDNALFNKSDNRLICYPSAVSQTKYEIPEGTVIVGSYAFYYCDNLTSIKIPNSVTTIESLAFSNCRSLTSINIPESITAIENGVFSSCTNMRSFTIPNGVTSIGEGAFTNCTSLSSINIPDTVTTIEGKAFSWCTSLTALAIPDSVVFIGNEVFTIYENGKYVPNNNLKLTVGRGSCAEQYCIDNGLKYTYLDANDWLNN